MSVNVSVVLARKGDTVATVAPETTLQQAAQELTRHRVGALVVSTDGRGLAGIVSERDLARALGRLGADCAERPVAEVMTAEVVTCTPDTTVDDLMATMTGRRIRHVPVVVDDALAGIVSIGDVVKSRLDELEVTAEAMEAYVTGSA